MKYVLSEDEGDPHDQAGPCRVPGLFRNVALVQLGALAGIVLVVADLLPRVGPTPRPASPTEPMAPCGGVPCPTRATVAGDPPWRMR